MKKNIIKDKIEDLIDLLENFESGDLIILTDIKTKLSDIINYADNAIKVKDLSAILKKINNEFDLILRADNQKELFLNLIELLKQISNIKNPNDFNNEKIKAISEKMFKSINEKLEKNHKIGIYPDDYFDNITDDAKMLLKYCDEANEHLDNAQISLLDLEYDSTNQENINHVFRCFHTIKSSSAFLGIKNIEEISHEVENILVLVRDGNMSISSDLVDVVFFGINMVRDLINIIETSIDNINNIIDKFVNINIYNYIKILKKILSNYKTKKIGEILSEAGKIDRVTIESILKRQSVEKKRFGEIALEEKVITEEDLKAAIKKQIMPSKKTSYVKVSNERLNFLIDMVGELVVTQSIIKNNINNKSLDTSVYNERSIAQLESITTSIKNVVLSMGMVPISEIFNKLKVVIRNASRELNKIVDVEISGEDTELDRNVIEAIYDPLIHIVRNSIDHGIETPEERRNRNKSEVGKILISANHRGSFIEISIYDDGKGIDKNKIIEKVVKTGIIKQGVQNISDKEIHEILFAPGFSTSEHVTEISGRGVGLDVVKRNVEQINGKIEINSEPGKFTKFIIRIPLTLAIIDGFVTLINGKKYIFPFNLIEEIVVSENNINKTNNGELMLNIRNKYVPIIFAGKLFNENYKDDLSKLVIILINHENNTYGIVVDEVIGKQEIVIKNLNEALKGLKYFSGGTIFGDGSIGFVVNIEKFIDNAKLFNH
jgi:two-component system chemotaxis sensor kinase CheA